MNKNIRNEVMWKRFQMENLLTNELKKFRFLYITGVFSKKLVHIFFYNDFIKNFKVLNIIRSYSFWN